MRRRGCVIFLAIVAALVAGGSTAYLASGEVRYLWRAATEEAAILHASRSIEGILRDSTLGGEHRAQLELVAAARDYAARIGYEAKDTYRKYADVGRDTLLLVVSASGRRCICPVVWKYPIVGAVPYKGFFVAADAEKAGKELAAKGYDTYLRPSGAFSTLGWFEDPLLSTALSRDSVELAALVFHEIAHNSLYVKSATPFNESFAQFAGYRAAERFFRDRGDSVHAAQAADRWHDEMVLGAYYRELVDRATAFYDTKPDSVALEAGRLELGRWVKAQLEGPVRDSLRTVQVATPVPERPINNARLVGVTIYRTKLPLFERWYEMHDRDVERSVAELRRLVEGAEGDEAFERLEKAVTEG
jgi:predicted aminopeptidase